MRINYDKKEKGKLKSIVEYQDLVALSQYDKESGKLDLNSWEIMEDATSRNRLFKSGLVTSGGLVTPLGLKQVKAMEDSLKELSKGIAFERRTKGDPKAIFERPPIRKWYHINAGGSKRLYTDDNLAIFMSKFPIKTLPYPNAKFVADIKSWLREWMDGIVVEVTPTLYQLISFTSPGLVWLTGKELSVAIQDRYCYYLQDKLWNLKFFSKGEDGIIHVRTPPYKRKDTKAFVMPFAVSDRLKPEALK